MMILEKGSGKVLWALIGIWLTLSSTSARKWNTNKDSIIVDVYSNTEDEEGELHFDALEQPDNVECLTLDSEPGVCVTMRRCHPILFGEKGELKSIALAEEYSKNVDTCQTQNNLDASNDEPKPPVPVPTKSSFADRILCCAKEKIQLAHRSSLEVSSEDMAMYQTTTPENSNAVPLNGNVEQVTQPAEEIVVLDSEAPEQPQSAIVDDSPAGPTGRPEVVEVIQQTQPLQQVDQDQNQGVTNAPAVEPEVPVVPLTQEEPAVEVVAPVEEPVQSVLEVAEPSQSNDAIEVCPAVQVYNTWPSFESYPYLAAIQTRSNSGPICSGSLIDDRHILTASACLHRFNSKDVARMQVRIGFTKNPENDTFNDFYQERKASKIILHKRFHEQSKMDNNIALVQLDHPIEFDEHVAPIRIFDSTRGFDQGQCAGVEAGWIKYGNRKVTGISEGVIHYIEPPMSDFVLREAINKIFTNSQCQSHLYSEITEDMLCAKTEMFEARGVNNDHFRGNDGGPLVIRVGDRVQQVGIKSWAYEGNQYPTVYTRVDRYLDWIKDNLQM